MIVTLAKRCEHIILLVWGGGKEGLPSKIIFNQFSRHIVVNFGYSTLMFPKMWRVGVKSKGDPWIKRLYSMQEACMVFSASEKWKRHVSEVSTKLMTLQTYDVFSINLVIVNNILFLSFLNISFDNTYSIIMSCVLFLPSSNERASTYSEWGNTYIVS